MIPQYIILSVISMLLMGMIDFLYGQAVRRGVSFATLMCVQVVVVLPGSAIWAYFQGGYSWGLLNLIGALTAILYFIGFYAFLKSVAQGELSVSAPIFRINFVITALIAILFLSERLTIAKFTGFLLAVLSIFLISGFNPLRLTGQKVRLSAIMWAVLAMIMVGTVNVFYKIGISMGLPPAMYLHSQSTFYTIISFLYAWRVQGGPRYSRNGWIFGLTVGACLFTGTTLLLMAMKTGEVSIVTPIAQLSFVISIIMANLWLGEKLNLRKITGLLAAGGTIVAFSI